MFRCQHCKSFNYVTRFYCDCGQEEEIGWVCGKCGNKIYKSKIFCSDCGQLLKEYDNREKETKNAPNKKEE